MPLSYGRALKILFLSAICIVLMLCNVGTSQKAKAVGDYITVKNNSGAMVNEGDLIKFEGVTAFNQAIPVKVYYMIYDPNNQLISSYNFIKQYTSDGREVFYQHQITANRGIFAKRGLYKIKVVFEKVSGNSKLIDEADFDVFVNVTEKPKEPTMTSSPTAPTEASTVVVRLTQGEGENSALLPLTFQYRKSIYEDWQTYNDTNRIKVTEDETYVYARACTSTGECSKVKSLLVTNVSETPETPATTRNAPSVYVEESRVAEYYFVGFKKDDPKVDNKVPIPSGTTPQP